jgi:TatD DNase family protein
MPIVIHTRNAMKETLETVKPFADKGLRGIFHCFSGNAKMRRKWWIWAFISVSAV